MALFNFSDDSLKKIETTTFDSEGILERKHLQAGIKKNIDTIAPNTLVIAEEFSEWTDSKRRIDLLAIDTDASLVVIELKRPETGERMELQAFRYAAMVSTLTFSRAVEIYKKYLESLGSEDVAQENLLKFLNWEEPKEDDFALDTRIVLVSADFSKELTTSVMWLNERSLDIRCTRLTPYKCQGQILIDIQHIIPLPEAESYQVKIKQQSEQRREARNSSRDYTKYEFNGSTYNKRRVALAIVKHWFQENNPSNLDELLIAFPVELCGDIFSLESDAIEIYERHGLPRHFLEKGEVFEFSDETRYAVSNQWAKENIAGLIKHARQLGFVIVEKR
ncbi:MAG: hypothetical protein KAR40_07610 [Candidatus Sabulitectum sp.]|nr:hypothetical protein [Candidatus Sabulitectum sp.]